MSIGPGNAGANNSSEVVDSSSRHSEELSHQQGVRTRLPTPLSVTLTDSLMGLLIAIGGIGTIIALLVVVVVLIVTTLPLLRPASIGSWHSMETATGYKHVGVDTSGLSCWAMTHDGEFHAISLKDGQLVTAYQPKKDLPPITCTSVSLDRNSLAIGFDDGSIVVADCYFEEELLNPRNEQTAEDRIPAGVSSAEPTLVSEGAIYQWLEGNGVRRIRLKPIIWSRRIQLCQGPITSIDMIRPSPSTAFGPVDDAHLLATGIQDDQLYLFAATLKQPAGYLNLTVDNEIEVTSTAIRARAADDTPLKTMLASGNQHCLVLWPNGGLDRFSLRGGRLELQESKSLSIGNQRILCATPLLGRQTLCCGTSDGHLLGWTISNSDSDDAATHTFSRDGFKINQSHRIALSDSAIVTLASGQQNQVVAAADQNRKIKLCYLTTDRVLASTELPGADVQSGFSIELVFGTAGTSLLASLPGRLYQCFVDAPHPEASWGTYFSPVWYQGHDRPKFIWQSTAASESSEIKLSLIPLLFGTVKAAAFTMLISIPIALMAALYTSEFLSSSARSRVKPIIELMAGIPGVVLGYLVAVVIAPTVGRNLIWIFCTAAIVPVLFLFAGRIWNLIASLYSISRSRWTKSLSMLLLFGLASLVASVMGQWLESYLFDGEFPTWLASGSGAATGGWLLLLTPVISLFYIMIERRIIPQVALRFKRSFPWNSKMIGVFRPLIAAITIFVLAWPLAVWLDGLGLDLRSNLFTSYQNRNALLVGAALGFGVIPIIFTIADDVFQMFPAAYRNASLACGATRWQTAVRLVLPSSISGLVSAVMLGFARAVGETMIVLMVVGNTPLMEWNPFSGLRALTATLATELPEAIKGSTHYRTLFLAAILLFAITLFANTMAEALRAYHRRRTGLP